MEIKIPLQNVKRILKELVKQPIVIAVDCPSGIDNDSGEVSDETIRADFTFCMAAVKQGLLKLPAYEYTGKLEVVDIGFTKKNSSFISVKRHVADEKLIRAITIKRPLDGHKGTFGTALIVAGSLNYAGAVLLAGKSAYRVGVGLVTLGVPSLLHAPLAGHFPEATWLLLPNDMGSISGPAASVLMKNFEKANALLIGCGLGMEETTYDFMESLLCDSAKTKKNQDRIGFVQNHKMSDLNQKYKIPPLVIDADGLKLLAKIPHWPKILPENSILTPHPGEMEILTGVSKEKIQDNRLSVAEHFAKEWQQTIVLKGAFTIIATPDGSTTTIPVATPALARAGSGDVLAGMIVGFRAQGMDAHSSAIAGAWFHAKAGLLAAECMGGVTSVIAGDIIEAISGVISLKNSEGDNL
jgi:NAD(P)H-hydrate epimerase